MEILGVTAGIIGVADPALRVVSALLSYGKDIRNAKSEKKLLIDELLALQGLLERLHVRETTVPGRDNLMQSADLARRFKLAYDDLVSILKYDHGKDPTPNKGRLKHLTSLAMWPFTKEDIYGILQRVSRLQDTCTLLLADEQNVLLQSVDQKQQAADRQRLKSLISSWLSPLNMTQAHQVISGRVATNCGQWFIGSPLFQDWTSGSLRLLWCHGIMGTGKSVIASVTNNHLRQLLISGVSPAVFVAVLYIKYDQHGQNTCSLLGSVIKQILQDLSFIPSRVTDLYKLHSDGATAATAEELVNTILSILDQNELFLIVDGLDEYNEELRWNLLDNLEMLKSKARIVIFSRFMDRLQEELEGFAVFEMTANKDDIGNFIDQHIKVNRNLRRLIDNTPSLRADIKEAIVSTAAGMFLLARLHMESIASAASLSIGHVRTRLSTLPHELNTAFNDAMRRVESQESEQRTLGLQILGWVTHVFRPISVKELQHALAFDPSESSLDEEAILEGHSITNLCGGLIMIDQTSNDVNVFHFSAMQYFHDHREKFFPEFHGVISRTCVTYLMLPSIASLTVDQIIRDFPLACYAAQYIGDHARLGPEDKLEEPVLKLLCRLFSHPRERKVLLSLLNGLDLISSGICEVGDAQGLMEMDQLATPDIPVTLFVINEQSDIHESRNEQRSLITELDSLSLITTHTSDVETLVETLSPRYPTAPKAIPEVTALHLAASMGLSKVANMLIDESDYIDTLDENGKTALTVAVEKGFEKAVELLLLSGALVDLKTHHGQLILLLVIERDWHEAAGALIRNATDSLNSEGTNECAPDVALMLAVLDNNTDWVKELILRMDPPISQSATAEFVLCLAVERESSVMIEELLKAGVNVNSRDSAEQTPLFRATKRRNASIMRLLLSFGALVDCRDINGRTPWAANIRCDALTLAILIEAGADPNTRGLQGSSELYTSAGGGVVNVVRYMLAVGTDPSIQTDFQWAPLHWAAYHGHFECLQLLVEAGAQLSPVSSGRVTPLDLAYDAGRSTVIAYLERRGAQRAVSIERPQLWSPKTSYAQKRQRSLTAKVEPYQTEVDCVVFYFEKPLSRALINPQFLGQSIRQRLSGEVSPYSYQISNCLDLAQRTLRIRKINVDDHESHFAQLNTSTYPLPPSSFDSNETLYNMTKTNVGFELRKSQQATDSDSFSMVREWTGDWNISSVQQDRRSDSPLLHTSQDWSTSATSDCRWMLKNGLLLARSGWEASSPRLCLTSERTGKTLQDLLVACWVAKLWSEAPVAGMRHRRSSSSAR